MIGSKLIEYAPFYTKLINATMRDAAYLLDGLLYHESELQIEEHYTDTAGFTDLWNTVYLELGCSSLAQPRQMIPEALLVHLSPLKWKHISLTGDYH